MKVLHLTLKKKWFDMILSGEKKEEYREMKPYWYRRLCDVVEWRMESYIQADLSDNSGTSYVFRKYDVIRFTNGYSKNAPSFDIECMGIITGLGKTNWGGGNSISFIIRLGKIISNKP